MLVSSLVVVGLAVAAAGCGGSSTSSTSTNSSATTDSSSAASGTAATAAFQSCLAQHGVKLSGAPRGAQPPGQPPANGQAGSQPPVGAQGTPGLTAAQRRAFTACQSKLPANLRGRLGQRPTAASNPALAKYTACLRKHGVSFGRTNNQSAFRKASTACAKYAPKAGS